MSIGDDPCVPPAPIPDPQIAQISQKHIIPHMVKLKTHNHLGSTERNNQRRLALTLGTLGLLAGACLCTSLPLPVNPTRLFDTNQQAPTVPAGPATPTPSAEADVQALADLAAASPAPRDRYDLAVRFLGVTETPVVTPTAPQVGDVAQFWVSNDDTEEVFQINARGPLVMDHSSQPSAAWHKSYSFGCSLSNPVAGGRWPAALHRILPGYAGRSLIPGTVPHSKATGKWCNTLCNGSRGTKSRSRPRQPKCGAV